jgi:hypothetical protein
MGHASTSASQRTGQYRSLPENVNRKFANHYFLNVSNIEQCHRTQKIILVHHRPFGIDL